MGAAALRSLGRLAGNARIGAGAEYAARGAGRLRLELRFTWLGASRVLDKMHTAGFDVFRHRQKLSAGDVPALVWHAMRWKFGQRGNRPGAADQALRAPDAPDAVPPDHTGDPGHRP